MFRKIALVALSAIMVVVLGVPAVYGVQQYVRNTEHNPVVRTIGNEVYAAEAADSTCDGIDDNVQFQAMLNALPATGGTLRIVSTGVFNWHAGTSVTRAISNVTIEGMGLGTYLKGDGSTPLFVAGGNNWVIRDLSTDAGGVNLGATTGWQEQNVLLGSTHYALRDTTGLTVLATINATQVNGTTGNFTGNLTVTGNITGGNISARDATVIVATVGATPAEKAIANFVLTGTNDAATLIAAFNTLPNHGAAINNTKTGFFKVIGGGNVGLGGLLDFPMMQDGKIDLSSIANMNGGGVRFDSMTDVNIILPLMASSTSNICIEIYPRNPGPDGIITFSSNQLECRALVAPTTTIGVSFNNSSVNFTSNRIIIDQYETTIPFRADGITKRDNTIIVIPTYQNMPSLNHVERIVYPALNTTANGSTSLTGFGFQPTLIRVFASTNATTGGQSWGVANNTTAQYLISVDSSGAYYQWDGAIARIGYGGTGNILVSLVSFDLDGLTFSITRTGLAGTNDRWSLIIEAVR